MSPILTKKDEEMLLHIGGHKPSALLLSKHHMLFCISFIISRAEVDDHGKGLDRDEGA